MPEAPSGDDRAARRPAATECFDALDALDALDVPVVYIAPDWRVTFASAAWARVVGGVDPALYVGGSFWEVLPALADAPEAAVVRATMADGVPRTCRSVYRDHNIDGTFDVAIRRTPEGGLLCTVHRASSEPALERVHHHLLESIGEGLFVADAGWRITYFNAEAERVTRTPRAQVLGRVLWEAFPTLCDTPLEAIYRETMETRTPRAASTVPLSRRAGGSAHALFDAWSYPVDGGGILVLFSEVTERERQRRALAERSAENEQLRELARVMAAVPDAAALLETLCAATVDLCGASGATVAQVHGDRGVFVAITGHPEELRGRSFPLAGTLTERALVAYQRTGRATPARADVGEADDAAFYPFLADGRRVGPLLLAPLGAHGELLGVLAVSRPVGSPSFDAADERRLQVVADLAALALWKARLVEEAREASETKSNFLATVSHELRTPLTALTGYGELLSDEILGPLTTGQHDVIERMRSVTHQLTAMIEEILTFSSLEAGRELVRPQPVDVADVVRAAVAVVEPLAQGKGLQFAAEVPPALPRIVTDPDKLRQILVNLAGNAVKFTLRGSVRLTVTADGDELRFSVVDTGVGIAAGDFGRLFQPFTQLDTGLTRRFGGTGLGLHISQRLARLLGGRIDVVSESGVGSTFTLRLPGRAPRLSGGGPAITA